MSKFSYETADCVNYELLKQFAKENRKNPTQAESVLWRYLEKGALGKPFRRQHIIGNFIADFFCLPCNLIIEIDGEYHQLPQQQISDAERTEWLEKQGYTVCRFTNEDVLYDTLTVIERIKKQIKK